MKCLHIVILLLVANPTLLPFELVLQLAVYKKTGGAVGTFYTYFATLALLKGVVEGVEIAIALEGHASVLGACKPKLGLII